MAKDEQEMRSLALIPTWSVATVLTILLAASLLVERGIHRLSYVSDTLAVFMNFVFLPCFFKLLDT